MKTTAENNLLEQLKGVTDRKICIIEPDEVYRLCARALLVAEDVAKEFIEFDNGYDALEWFLFNDQSQAQVPDIILLNTKLPDMDGLRFLETFAELNAKLAAKIDCYIVNADLPKAAQLRLGQCKMVKDFFPKPLQDAHIEKIKQKELEQLIFEMYQSIAVDLSIKIMSDDTL